MPPFFYSSAAPASLIGNIEFLRHMPGKACQLFQCVDTGHPYAIFILCQLRMCIQRVGRYIDNPLGLGSLLWRLAHIIVFSPCISCNNSLRALGMTYLLTPGKCPAFSIACPCRRVIAARNLVCPCRQRLTGICLFRPHDLFLPPSRCAGQMPQRRGDALVLQPHPAAACRHVHRRWRPSTAQVYARALHG